MRFSIAVLILGLARTMVSALPIAPTDLESRDDFEASDMLVRDFDEPATSLYLREDTHYAALHRSKVGTEHEHWALHIHPENKGGDWHIVDAVSDKSRGGVLDTTRQNKRLGPYDPSKQGPNHHIIGTFSSAEQAAKSAKAIQQIKLKEPYPCHNCVDWTKKAVDHMVKNGHIQDHNGGIQNFHNIYDQNHAAVRAKTATQENKHAAGHKK